MNFVQLIPFDTAKGGTTPNLCLDNVRKGYGIDNKYNSAWEAWEHTQQHADRNIPAGLDVPLFYTYTATIDGVTQNYGHINVSLKNGTVWSDGNIYASVDDYMSKKLPRFVGWGESVNDFKIIQGEDMAITQDNLYSLIRAMTRREPTQEEVTNQKYLDDPNFAIETFWNNVGKASYETPAVQSFTPVSQLYTKD